MPAELETIGPNELKKNDFCDKCKAAAVELLQLHLTERHISAGACRHEFKAAALRGILSHLANELL